MKIIYGGLNLVKESNGEYYLLMEDCRSDDVFGPLNDEQIKAFHTLCEAGDKEKIKEAL